MQPTDGAVAAPARILSFRGEAPVEAARMVPEEVAVNVVFATVPFAVMMMTPRDLEDFATGFCLTEGVIATAAEIRGARVEAAEGGLLLRVDLEPGRLRAHLDRRRTLSGRTGCGACGIEELADLPWATRAPGAGVPIARDAIRRALDALAGQQVLNGLTGAVHAAAFAGLDGALHLVREDVGRHNALDKLIGAAMRAGMAPADGFVLVTSRCSFEMVEKVAAFGGHTLVAISAPTSLALDRARRHGIALVGVARRDTMTVFNGAERIGAERVLAC